MSAGTPRPPENNPYKSPYGAPPPLPNASAPCPRCGNPTSTPVKFTWWGGLLGPKLLSHVKCNRCGTAYNGKSGQSNTTGIIIYSVIAFVVALAIVAMLFAAGVWS